MHAVTSDQHVAVRVRSIIEFRANARGGGLRCEEAFGEFDSDASPSGLQMKHAVQVSTLNGVAHNALIAGGTDRYGA
jgi:hypothetical protein